MPGTASAASGWPYAQLAARHDAECVRVVGSAADAAPGLRPAARASPPMRSSSRSTSAGGRAAAQPADRPVHRADAGRALERLCRAAGGAGRASRDAQRGDRLRHALETATATTVADFRRRARPRPEAPLPSALRSFGRLLAQRLPPGAAMRSAMSCRHPELDGHGAIHPASTRLPRSLSARRDGHGHGTVDRRAARAFADAGEALPTVLVTGDGISASMRRGDPTPARDAGLRLVW